MSKIAAITADNASVNGKIGRILSDQADITFSENQMLGCCAHVINLAAKQGLKLFGDDSIDDDTLVPQSLLDIVEPPDNASVNLKTIYARIHGLALFTRKTPQRSQSFSSVISLVRSLKTTSNPDEHQSNDLESSQNEALAYFRHNQDPNIDEQPPSQTSKSADQVDRMMIDVPTRWNSSYLMLKRALRLKSACIQFCERQARQFSLSDLEWDYVEQMCDFLEPLSEATDMLCQRKFPTMHEVIPVYTVIIEGLLKVQSLHLFPRTIEEFFILLINLSNLYRSRSRNSMTTTSFYLLRRTC